MIELEQLQSLLTRREKFGPLGALDYLIRTHQRKIRAKHNESSDNFFQTKPVALPESLDAYKKWPRSLPEGIVLPELVGVANDYTHLLDEIDKTPDVAVSIVIPTYNRRMTLEKTLAGLINQDYDLSKIEVIVTDDGGSDGTESLTKKYKGIIDIKYIWHPDIGYTPGIARNRGIEWAKNDFIILLDADMFPSRDLVKTYVKYHRIIDQVVLIGPRTYKDLNSVSAEDLLKNHKLIDSLPNIITNNPVAGMVEGDESVDWRIPIILATDHLKQEPRPFRMLAAGNVALSRKKFIEVGKFDERFMDWGYEDGELGFRFYNNGFYFIPVLDAIAHHQEPKDGANETDRAGGKSKTGPLYGTLCPYYRHLAKESLDNYEVPTVSIYIPAYNAEATIVDAIESALNQTYSDLEVCICDDGSTDNTVKIIEALYSYNPRVRWITQENKGIGAASNAAVELCRGTYIGQLDSDDILALDAVEKCIPYFEQNAKIGLVYTTYENQNIDGTITPGYNYPVFTREKFISAMIVHHFRMFRRRDWARTKFDEQMRNAIDYDFYLKLAEMTEVRHLNIVGYRRRLHGQNTSIKYNTTQNMNAAKAVNMSLARQSVNSISCYLKDKRQPNLSFKERE